VPNHVQPPGTICSFPSDKILHISTRKSSCSIAEIMVPGPISRSGNLHRYSKRLVAFEHASKSSLPAKHTLLFVGGLGDGLLTVSYPSILSDRYIPPEWSVVQISLMSSLNGWGSSSLQRDAREIAECVEYFRKVRPAGSKIVLAGHSTGCQDAMEYHTGKGSAGRPVIDGVILQAPVSDREAMAMTMKKSMSEAIVKTAREWIAEGRGDDALPQVLGGLRNPVTAYRWLSLISPDKTGDDDYFSSDLPDETLKKSFGAFKKTTPLLILISGADEHVPAFISKEGLAAKWSRFAKDGEGIVDEENGGVVAGAHHNYEQDGEEIVADACKRISNFLEKVASGKFHSVAVPLL
jgi:alpha-beta hydrolase superfamily lysophospholipase